MRWLAQVGCPKSLAENTSPGSPIPTNSHEGRIAPIIPILPMKRLTLKQNDSFQDPQALSDGSVVWNREICPHHVHWSCRICSLLEKTEFVNFTNQPETQLQERNLFTIRNCLQSNAIQTHSDIKTHQRIYTQEKTHWKLKCLTAES